MKALNPLFHGTVESQGVATSRQVPTLPGNDLAGFADGVAELAIGLCGSLCGLSIYYVYWSMGACPRLCGCMGVAFIA